MSTNPAISYFIKKFALHFIVYFGSTDVTLFNVGSFRRAADSDWPFYRQEQALEEIRTKENGSEMIDIEKTTSSKSN